MGVVIKVSDGVFVLFVEGLGESAGLFLSKSVEIDLRKIAFKLVLELSKTGLHLLVEGHLESVSELEVFSKGLATEIEESPEGEAEGFNMAARVFEEINQEDLADGNGSFVDLQTDTSLEDLLEGLVVDGRVGELGLDLETSLLDVVDGVLDGRCDDLSARLDGQTSDHVGERLLHTQHRLSHELIGDGALGLSGLCEGRVKVEADEAVVLGEESRAVLRVIKEGVNVCDLDAALRGIKSADVGRGINDLDGRVELEGVKGLDLLTELEQVSELGLLVNKLCSINVLSELTAVETDAEVAAKETVLVLVDNSGPELLELLEGVGQVLVRVVALIQRRDDLVQLGSKLKEFSKTEEVDGRVDSTLEAFCCKVL